MRCVSWENRKRVADAAYDLVINLEDDRETSRFLKELNFKQFFGAYLNGDDKLAYTSDSQMTGFTFPGMIGAARLRSRS